MHPTDRPPTSRTPDAVSPLALSIVLPVLNEEQDIGRLLHEILSQTEPPGGYEVLVADGGSTDRTREIVLDVCSRDARVRLVDNPKRLSSAGRNAGTRAARGTYVMFLDGHCSIPRRDYLARTMEIFRDTGADCLCRPQYLTELAQGPWASAIAAARHSRLGHNHGSDIYGGAPGYTDPCSAGAAYRSACIQAVGGYDERFDACEDVEFNRRIALAGFTAYRHPDLRIDYRPRTTLGGLYRQMFRYGRGRARLMSRHTGLVPVPLVAITALAPASLAFLALDTRAALPAVGILFAAWLLAVSFESLRVSGYRIVAAARTGLAFAAIYAGLVLGFWRGIPEMPRYRGQMAAEGGSGLLPSADS